MGVWLRRPHHHQHHKHTGAITEELSSYVVVVRRRTPPHIYLHFHIYIYIYIFIFIYIFIHIYIYIRFPFMKPLVFICGTYGYTTRNQGLRFTLSVSDMYPESWTHIYKLGGSHGSFPVFYMRHPFCFCLNSFVIVIIYIFFNSFREFFKRRIVLLITIIHLIL